MLIVYCRISTTLISGKFNSFSEAKSYAKKNKGVILKTAHKCNPYEEYILDIFPDLKADREDRKLPENENADKITYAFSVVTDERAKKQIMEMVSEYWKNPQKYTKDFRIW